MPTIRLTDLPAWRALEARRRELPARGWLRGQFKSDPGRAERFRAEAAGLFFDYSKQRIDDGILRSLLDLAEQVNLRDRIEARLGAMRASHGYAARPGPAASRTPPGSSS